MYAKVSLLFLHQRAHHPLHTRHDTKDGSQVPPSKPLLKGRRTSLQACAVDTLYTVTAYK